MSGDSPWMPRRERERPKAAPATYWWWAFLGLATLAAVAVCFFILRDPSDVGSWIPLLLVLAAIQGAGLLVMFVALPASSRRRERLVQKVRPGQAVLTMRTIATTQSALDRLADARHVPRLGLGRTFAVSVGPQSLEVWGNPSRPPLVIPYTDILTAAISAQTVDIDQRGGRGVEYPGSVEFELPDGEGGTVILPLVPRATSIASLNDDRVEYFVEQLSLVTALPWVDAETPPDP